MKNKAISLTLLFVFLMSMISAFPISAKNDTTAWETSLAYGKTVTLLEGTAHTKGPLDGLVDGNVSGENGTIFRANSNSIGEDRWACVQIDLGSVQKVNCFKAYTQKLYTTSPDSYIEAIKIEGSKTEYSFVTIIAKTLPEGGGAFPFNTVLEFKTPNIVSLRYIRIWMRITPQEGEKMMVPALREFGVYRLILDDIAGAQLETYGLPSCYQESTIFSVEVDGNYVPVIKYLDNQKTEYHYAHFSFSGTVKIRVAVNSDIETCRIRPDGYGIPGTVEGNNLTFKLSQSKYLMININNLQNLVIIADTLEKDVPLSTGSGIYNIKEEPYNADDTGAQDATEIIQSALDVASVTGGIVYVPEGVYKISSITMRGNVKLYLECGAVLRGTGKTSDYVLDNPDSTSQAITTMIRFEEGASNMKIYGRGTIDCNGESLYDDGGGKDPTAYRISGLRPDNNSNVIIEGIIVSHSRTWTVVPQKSDNLTIENVKVLNSGNRNENDGIDICSCQDVLIRHCFTYTNDDSLCVKACKSGSFKGVYKGDAEKILNIVFDDIVTYGKCAGTKAGIQGYSHIDNVWFKNIEVLQASRGIVIQHDQGSETMENIHFVNINIEELVWRKYSPFPIEMEITSKGNVYNVEVTNVTFKEFGNGDTGDGYTGTDSIINGKGENSGIHGVAFNNLKIAGNVILGLEPGHITTNCYATNIIFTGSYAAEAETLSADVSAGGSYDIKNSDNACGKKYIVGKLNTTHDHIQYTLQNIEQGTYKISVVLGKETDKGIWKLKVGGSNKEFSVDRVSSTEDFVEVDIGTVTFDTTGSKTLSFVLSGKSTASRIAIDTIKLTKIIPPPGFIPEYTVVGGTETARFDNATQTGFWVDYTGDKSSAETLLTISQNEGIIDFHFERKEGLSGAANRLHQLWTPENNTKMEEFIASDNINYMTMRIKLSEPPTSNPYEYAIALGNFAEERNVFLGELIRFSRPVDSKEQKIILGGTPTTTTDTDGLQIYLKDGTGTELMSYGYNKWYTISFEINTDNPRQAVITATVLDEETAHKTVSKPYSIATVDSISGDEMCINALRTNTYVGYGGMVGDDFHIYLDHIKLIHRPSYTLNFYRDSVATHNKIDVLEEGTIVGEAVLQEGYFQNTEYDSLYFVMAVYRDDKLIDISIKSVTETDLTVVLDVSDVQSDDKIKWFTWNGFGQLNPVEKVRQFDSEGLKY